MLVYYVILYYIISCYIMLYGYLARRRGCRRSTWPTWAGHRWASCARCGARRASEAQFIIMIIISMIMIIIIMISSSSSSSSMIITRTRLLLLLQSIIMLVCTSTSTSTITPRHVPRLRRRGRRRHACRYNLPVDLRGDQEAAILIALYRLYYVIVHYITLYN